MPCFGDLPICIGGSCFACRPNTFQCGCPSDVNNTMCHGKNTCVQTCINSGTWVDVACRASTPICNDSLPGIPQCIKNVASSFAIHSKKM